MYNAYEECSVELTGQEIQQFDALFERLEEAQDEAQLICIRNDFFDLVAPYY